MEGTSRRPSFLEAERAAIVGVGFVFLLAEASPSDPSVCLDLHVAPPCFGGP